MNWIDIIVILVIGLSILNGWHKGLINAVIGLAKWILGTLVANFFYKEAADYFIDNVWNPIPIISEKIRFFLEGKLQISNGSDVPMAGSDVQVAIEQLNLPQVYEHKLNAYFESMANTTANNFITTLAELISHAFVEVMCFLVILFLAMGVIGLVGMMINQIAKLPVLNELNRGGGLIIGAFMGLLTVYFLMLIASILYPFQWMVSINQAISESQIGIYFYEYNILEQFISSMLAKAGQMFMG